MSEADIFALLGIVLFIAFIVCLFLLLLIQGQLESMNDRDRLRAEELLAKKKNT